MTHTWQYNHPFFLKKSADPTYQSLISFPNPLSLSPPSPHISLYHRAAEEKSRMATGGGGDGGSSGTVDRKPRMATRQRQCLIYYGGSRHSWMPRMATQGRFSPSQPLPPPPFSLIPPHQSVCTTRRRSSSGRGRRAVEAAPPPQPPHELVAIVTVTTTETHRTLLKAPPPPQQKKIAMATGLSLLCSPPPSLLLLLPQQQPSRHHRLCHSDSREESNRGWGRYDMWPPLFFFSDWTVTYASRKTKPLRIKSGEG